VAASLAFDLSPFAPPAAPQKDGGAA
jgi:hypothetical protein